MDFSEVKAHAARLGRVVFMATTRPDGRPHNVPLGTVWVDDKVTAFVMNTVKVDNIRHDPRVHLHWQVSEETGHDSLVMDGLANVIDTTDGRTALWDKMDYDPYEFEPDGPSSDRHVFIQIEPIRASLLYRYGFDGRDTWEADETVIDLRETTTEA